MERREFWNLIEECRSEAGHDIDEIAPLLIDRLSEMPAEEIISFEQHLWDLMAESYKWDLWGVAYIINGGCSDDAFDYFRGWLLGQGRERWEQAMQNPEIIGEWTDDEVEFEPILYVASQAYENVTSHKSFPKDAITVSLPDEPTGVPWEEDDLEQRFPTLWEKFSG